MIKIIFYRLINLIKYNLISQNKYILGRWKLDNITKTNIKIDNANEDHCGTCTNDKKKLIKK